MIRWKCTFPNCKNIGQALIRHHVFFPLKTIHSPHSLVASTQSCVSIHFILITSVVSTLWTLNQDIQPALWLKTCPFYPPLLCLTHAGSAPFGLDVLFTVTTPFITRSLNHTWINTSDSFVVYTHVATTRKVLNQNTQLLFLCFPPPRSFCDWIFFPNISSITRLVVSQTTCTDPIRCTTSIWRRDTPNFYRPCIGWIQ